MDDYPAELAPEFDEGGGVATPFPEWWGRVSRAFPHVPEDVAEQWLHRHWKQSPYGWMRSTDYTFQLIDWKSSRLSDIASGANDWDFANSLQRGRQLIEVCADSWLVRYMLERHNIPRPLIVLDNRLGSVAREKHLPTHHKNVPAGFVLIEGHTRFELAASLHSCGKLARELKVWLMERR